MSADETQRTAVRSEPEVDWSAISAALHELWAAMLPLKELPVPPDWAVTLGFVMERVLPHVELSRIAAMRGRTHE